MLNEYMAWFTFHVKSEEIYADLAGDVKKIFDTCNYGVKRPLPIRKERSG